jgi:hypothetical protein
METQQVYGGKSNVVYHLYHPQNNHKWVVNHPQMVGLWHWFTILSRQSQADIHHIDPHRSWDDTTTWVAVVAGDTLGLFRPGLLRTPRNSGSHDSSDFGQSFPDYGYKNLESFFFVFCSQSFPGQFGKPQLGVSLAYLVTIHPLALRPRCQKGARMPPLPDSKGRLGSIHRGMICSKGKNLKDLWNLGVFLGIFHGKDFLDYVGFAMNYLFMFG